MQTCSRYDNECCTCMIRSQALSSFRGLAMSVVVKKNCRRDSPPHRKYSLPFVTVSGFLEVPVSSTMPRTATTRSTSPSSKECYQVNGSCYELGRGASSIVWRGRDRSTNLLVAIKIIQKLGEIGCFQYITVCSVHIIHISILRF